MVSIARVWGFTDPSRLARRFRAAYGVTPSQWHRASEVPGEQKQGVDRP
ncbi:AraC family transcriptional regulator [Streptomyces mirabilis]